MNMTYKSGKDFKLYYMWNSVFIGTERTVIQGICASQGNFKAICSEREEEERDSSHRRKLEKKKQLERFETLKHSAGIIWAQVLGS